MLPQRSARNVEIFTFGRIKPLTQKAKAGEVIGSFSPGLAVDFGSMPL